MQPIESIRLSDYTDAAGLLAAINAFPTKDSLSWFVRRHRDALAKEAAVIFVTGRILYHPSRFEQVVLDIGRRATRSLA